MTVLFLIRHGETDWLGKRLVGRLPGIHLNENGQAQAAELVRSFAGVPVTAVYSSPLERAMETAEPVGRAAGKPVERRDSLQEVNFGSLDGKTFPELKALGVWREVHLHPEESRYPGGESLGEVQTRIVTEMQSLAARHPRGAVLLFSHSDTIRVGLAWFARIPLSHFHDLIVDPASISIVYLRERAAKVAGFNWPAGVAVPWREEE